LKGDKDNKSNEKRRQESIPVNHYKSTFGERPNYVDTIVFTAVTGHTYRQIDKANDDLNSFTTRGITDTRRTTSNRDAYGIMVKPVYGFDSFMLSGEAIANTAENIYRQK